ncbi:MAG TPA: VOC family protein [Nitrososphaerales archaeon]|nr:VOC family protein [Nitrososphaerales archaeon]
MTQINPYLRFDAKCREAMRFYQECLGGGDLQLTTVGESAMAKQMPAEMQQQIMHANLTKGRLTLLGSDMVGPEGLVRGNSFVLQVECDSEDEIRTLYSKLSSGGKATYPISPSFWGGLYGQLIDKYGNGWMLNYQKPAK